MNIARYAFGTFQYIVTDLDDTLAESCKPITDDVASALISLMRSGVSIAIITMQSIQEILDNVWNPLMNNNISPQFMKGDLFFFTSGGTSAYKAKFDGRSSILMKLYEINKKQMITRALFFVKNELDDIQDHFVLRDRITSISLGLSNRIAQPDRFQIMSRLDLAIQRHFGTEMQFHWKPHKPNSAHILPKGISKGVAIQYLLNEEKWKNEGIIVLGDDFGEGGFDLSLKVAGALHISVGDSLGEESQSVFRNEKFINVSNGGIHAGYYVLVLILSSRPSLIPEPTFHKTDANVLPFSYVTTPVVYRKPMSSSIQRDIKFSTLDLLNAALPLTKLCLSTGRAPVILIPVRSGGNRLAHAASSIVQRFGYSIYIGPPLYVPRNAGISQQEDKNIILNWLMELNRFVTEQNLVKPFRWSFDRSLSKIHSCTDWPPNEKLQRIKQAIDQFFSTNVYDMIYQKPELNEDELNLSLFSYCSNLDELNCELLAESVKYLRNIYKLNSTLGQTVDDCRYNMYAYVLKNIGWRLPVFSESDDEKNNGIDNRNTASIVIVDDSISFGRVGYFVQMIKNILSPISVEFYVDSAPLEPYYIECKWGKFGNCAPDYWRTSSDRLVEDIAWFNPYLEGVKSKAPVSQEEKVKLFEVYIIILKSWRTIKDCLDPLFSDQLGICSPADIVAMLSIISRKHPEERLRFAKKCFPLDFIRAGLGMIEKKRADKWFVDQLHQVFLFMDIPDHVKPYIAQLNNVREIEDRLVFEVEQRLSEYYFESVDRLLNLVMKNQNLKLEMERYLFTNNDFRKIDRIGNFDFMNVDDNCHKFILQYGMIGFSIFRGHPLIVHMTRFWEG